MIEALCSEYLHFDNIVSWSLNILKPWGGPEVTFLNKLGWNYTSATFTFLQENKGKVSTKTNTSQYIENQRNLHIE